MLVLAQSEAPAWIAAGAAAVTAIGAVVSGFRVLLDSRQRKTSNFPDISGSWKATWHLDDNVTGYEEKLFTDDLEFKSIRGLKVTGNGHDPNFGNYNFEGRISASRVLTLYYRFTKYPAIEGVIFLRLIPSGRTAKGYWYGLMDDEEIRGGRAEIARAI
ncbi:MAG: hypothetical protein HKN23_05310 [Verrucomicrobiales bacterium]|nr:hypothetical protein [Verrucomicrobiales bacterium]